MAFRYEEIGQRLKAYRLGSGLSADDIARKIGISRTALYRFERGELAKIDTLEKLADLLGVSIPTLLGVGIEYIPSAVSYFERVRQLEETTEQIMMLSGPLSLLLASDDFQRTLEAVLKESVTRASGNAARSLADVDQIMEILRTRKTAYLKRRPGIVSLMSVAEIDRFLEQGFVGRKGLPPPIQAERRALARAEIEHLVQLIEGQPIGVQIGIVTDTLPHLGFQLLRQPDRKLLVMTPYRIGVEPNVSVGVSMITSAPDAIAMHEEVINDLWKRALKGQAAADCLRALLRTKSDGCADAPAANRPASRRATK